LATTSDVPGISFAKRAPSRAKAASASVSAFAACTACARYDGAIDQRELAAPGD
jgi:hypothetical protein